MVSYCSVAHLFFLPIIYILFEEPTSSSITVSTFAIFAIYQLLCGVVFLKSCHVLRSKNLSLAFFFLFCADAFFSAAYPVN